VPTGGPRAEPRGLSRLPPGKHGGCNEFAIHFCDFLSRHRNRARIGTTSVRLGCSLQGTDMLPVQCKAARVALGIGERELAAKAGVSPDTVSRLEKGEALHQRTGIAIREALEAAGVEFTPDGGVRLKER
jgi:DNA-binding XRE family transcriptional regulator